MPVLINFSVASKIECQSYFWLQDWLFLFYGTVLFLVFIRIFFLFAHASTTLVVITNLLYSILVCHNFFVHLIPTYVAKHLRRTNNWVDLSAPLLLSSLLSVLLRREVLILPLNLIISVLGVVRHRLLLGICHLVLSFLSRFSSHLPVRHLLTSQVTRLRLSIKSNSFFHHLVLPLLILLSVQLV